MEQSKAVAAEATRRVEERNGTSTCTMLENGIIGKNAMGHRPDVAQVEIGSRVAVFWPQDNLYYEATVTQIRDKTRLWHLLDYDDGRSEWTELDQCKFRVLPEGIRHRTDDEIQDNYYDSFELESQAPADDEYQNENYGRREGKPNGDGIDASSFRRVLQGTNKRHGGHGIQGKQNVPSNTTSLETDPSKSAAGTQDKETRKDNAAIKMELVLPHPSLFSAPSADLDQVAAFVERFVERAIQSSSGTNFNSSSEKATKARSGKRRSSSIAKVTTKTTTGKKLKYSTEKATKETPGERKRNSSIEKATVGKKRKSSHEKAPKETPGMTRTHPIEKAAMKTGGKTLKATTRETPLKKHSFSIGTKVRKFFTGFGWFDGKVTSCDGEYYDVTYEDGDSEQCRQDELEKIILTPDLANVEVGSRVAVRSPTNGKYHEATVARERNKHKPFFLEYNDGHREWTDLCQCTFRLLPGGTRRRGDDEIGDDSESDDDSSEGEAFASDDEHDETVYDDSDSDSEFEFD